MNSWGHQHSLATPVEGPMKLEPSRCEHADDRYKTEYENEPDRLRALTVEFEK
jgi:hypothetical protein